MNGSTDEPRSGGFGQPHPAGLAPQPGLRYSMAGPTRVERELVLPHSLDAARVARGWLGQEVAGFAAELAGDIVLMTSELVSNAVSHGKPEVRLGIRVTPQSAYVAVSDRSGSLPVLPDRTPEPTLQSGRGLFLVSRLATQWGYTSNLRGPGKTVWFIVAT